MFVDSVHFRKAGEVDFNSIWDLLLANSIVFKDEEILQLIDRIYVLEYQKRILGVLCGTYSRGQVNILWIAIHPLYPEYSLQEAMIQQFTAIFCRIPGDRVKRNPVLQWFRKRFPLLFIKTEGVTHGVQD
jgi:hypothetical protein